MTRATDLYQLNRVLKAFGSPYRVSYERVWTHYDASMTQYRYVVHRRDMLWTVFEAFEAVEQWVDDRTAYTF